MMVQPWLPVTLLVCLGAPQVELSPVKSDDIMTDTSVSLAATPSTPMMTASRPSCISQDKGLVELRADLTKNVADIKQTCLTAAVSEYNSCVPQNCPAKTVEQVRKSTDSCLITADDDCDWISDAASKANCDKFHNQRKQDCDRMVALAEKEYPEANAMCTKKTEACTQRLSAGKSQCLKKAIVNKAIAMVRVDNSEIAERFMASSIEEGKIELESNEMKYLLEQEDFVKAFEAVKACQASKEPFYGRLVERTVAQLVTEWRAIRKEFQAKRNGIKGLTVETFQGNCEDKEFAAVSSMGDFKAKIGFLSSLAHACSTECQWNGERCVTSTEEAVSQKTNSSIVEYEKCYAELLAVPGFASAVKSLPS